MLQLSTAGLPQHRIRRGLDTASCCEGEVHGAVRRADDAHRDAGGACQSGGPEFPLRVSVSLEGVLCAYMYVNDRATRSRASSHSWARFAPVS
jgi:hypothetical protein